MAKTIKDLIKDYLKEQDLIKAYNGSCDSIEQACEYGANAVLEKIETYLNNLDLGNSTEEKFYKLDAIADMGLFIKQLKGE